MRTEHIHDILAHSYILRYVHNKEYKEIGLSEAKGFFRQNLARKWGNKIAQG
jgi:hypothetical protein